MATSKISLPDDPIERRAHLAGLDSALRGLDDGDVALARPTLEPYASIFDGGRSAGLMMASRNGERRKALQQGVGGRRHNIVTLAEEKEARRPPPLP